MCTPKNINNNKFNQNNNDNNKLTAVLLAIGSSSYTCSPLLPDVFEDRDGVDCEISSLLPGNDVWASSESLFGPLAPLVLDG